jgi:hypothetical protein
MASPLDVVRRWLAPRGERAKSDRKGPPNAGGKTGQSQYGVLEPRRGARTLRDFSETNPWVRIAINYRKRAITKADFAIVRIGNDKTPPDDHVVRACNDLFAEVNDTGENLSWMLAKLTEDILVMDAGVIEKETTFTGEIKALWTIPGEEIAPDPKWDGRDPNRPRYYQYRDGKLIGAYTNDELTYMMQNPRTNSAVGFSPLEALFETVEAELYSAKMESRLMKETAPAGLMYLGAGVPPKMVQAFRDQWENDIAAQRGIAFFGGGDEFDGKGGAPTFIPFRGSAREEQRREYTKWLVTKIAACFEVDLLVFNLSETITKANGGNLSAKTDAGLISLGDTIAKFITREIIWKIDPTHQHKFEFVDLTPRDTDAEIDRMGKLMAMGATTPNQVRISQGWEAYEGSADDPEHWANLPYPFQQNTMLPPAEDPIEDDQPTDPEGVTPSDDDDDPDAKPSKPAKKGKRSK